VPPDVHLDNLTVRYPKTDRAAVEQLSASIEPGESVALLGPNGSGKSTLFRVLATLLAPTAGSARVLGQDVTVDPAAVRAQVAVVFQSPALDRELTARENLRCHARMMGLGRREARNVAHGLLSRVVPDDVADLPAKKLSGGLRRRIDLARAVLVPKPIVLLDEPTVGLDPQARRDAWQLVGELRAEAAERLGRPITLLVTTHLLDDLAPAGVERVILLDRGRVVADDGPAALCDAAGGRVIVLEPAAGMSPTDLLAKLPPHLSAAKVIGGGVEFESADAQAELSDLLARLPGELFRRASVGPVTLEDVYLRRTGRPLQDSESGSTSGRA
jgi:ABC-2 type transport system ATP-binding protein